MGLASRRGQFPRPLYGNNAPSSSEVAWRSEWKATSTGLGTAGLEADTGRLRRAVPRLSSLQLPPWGRAHSAVLGGGAMCTAQEAHLAAAIGQQGPGPKDKGSPVTVAGQVPSSSGSPRTLRESTPVRNRGLQVAVPLGL